MRGAARPEPLVRMSHQPINRIRIRCGAKRQVREKAVGRRQTPLVPCRRSLPRTHDARPYGHSPAGRSSEPKAKDIDGRGGADKENDRLP